jgi:putative 4-mercaptohistidine N1-methyltranferase
VNVYETEKLLAEYLLFHYGAAGEILPYPFGPREALEYPARCVSECFGELPANARALDLGCAVGRSSFELARRCSEVIGIDYSQSFITAATKLRYAGTMDYARVDEGARTTPLVARVPGEIDRTRVKFERGDAQALREGLGVFDVVLMANLIDRLREPARCLAQLARLVKPGGQLVITSPYTWLEEYTPREHWLCGETGDTLAGLRAALDADFALIETKDLPFLIREHARKFQWSVAQASLWRRR